MNDQLQRQDLNDVRMLLDALLSEVETNESTLAGGTKLGVGKEAVDSLRQTRISFGDPSDNLIRLTPALFERVGVELTEIRRRQMREQFDFYYMTLTVSLQPKGGAQFTQLECALDLGPEQARPIVQTLFPTSAWREVLNWGGSLDLGLNGSLSWSVGMEQPAEAAGTQLPAEVQANIANKNALSAVIVIPSFSYSLGRSDIVAAGEGNTRCFWRIEKPELRTMQTVQFGVVFKVPQGTENIVLTGLVVAEPNTNWLVANLRHVIDDLSDRFKALFGTSDRQRTGKDRLPIGDHETWTIALPG